MGDVNLSALRPLGFALCYQARGFAVLPLREASKLPASPHGLKDASTDVDQLVSWWLECPTFNVGIRTGAVSGIAVLDVDPEGDASLAELPPLPHTWSSITPRGRHFYFRHPGREVRNSAGKLGPGLDVRGDGGYVVAPPSIVGGIEYRWAGDHHKLAPWPSFLNVAPNGGVTTTESPEELRAGAIGRPNRYAMAALEREAETVREASVGTRNDALNAATWAVSRFAPAELSARLIAETLLSAAMSAGLPEREASSTIASALGARWNA
jgi:hypothetical protein